MNNPIPLETMESVDVMVVRKDGGVDLVIITSRHLDASEETEKRLLQKINNYVSTINAEEFIDEFKEPHKDRISIKISCIDEPDEEIKDLLFSIRSQVEDHGASLEWYIK